MIKIITMIAMGSMLFVSTKLWECNRCHQQYQGNSPPPFVKCPATNFKQTHWWIQKH